MPDIIDIEVYKRDTLVDIEITKDETLVDIEVLSGGTKGDPGQEGYTPIKGVDYFDGDTPTIAVGTVTTGDTAHIENVGSSTEAIFNFTLPKGDKGDPGTTDYTELLNPPDLSVYAEKTNVLQLDNTIEFTPDSDYEPAPKKYVDDHVGRPAGNDTAIQFNDNGAFGGVDAFRYDRLSGAVTLGEAVEVLPQTPLAVQKDIDDYVQVTFQNKSDNPFASMDIVITADNGTDTTHYLDMGVNSSTFNDVELPILKSNDTYIYAVDDDIDIGTGGAGKTLNLFAGGFEETNISARVDTDGINLPAGKTFRIDGTPIGSAPDFLALTDAPDSYVGQAGKAVAVKPTEDGVEFISISGLGDMKVSVYDPTGVAKDAFDTDNHTSGTINKVYTATEQSKLAGIASGAEVNVQADWNESNSGSDAYIKNKPTIPSGLTPADTVVSETSYGQAASVGTSTNYAREDHTHGTPAGGTGISEAQAIAFSCALGGI